MNRVFYKSSLEDPFPVYVFDSTQYSQPFEWREQLPSEPFSLVLFAGGLSSDERSSVSFLESPKRVFRFFQSVPQDTKKNMRNLYLVHENWLGKSIADIALGIWQTFAAKVTVFHCESLACLGSHIRVRKLPVSLHVHLLDQAEYSGQLTLSRLTKVFNNLITFLSVSDLDVPLSPEDWHSLACLEFSDFTTANIDILYGCLVSGQKLVLQDYSFVEHYGVLVRFVTAKNIVPLQELGPNFDETLVRLVQLRSGYFAVKLFRLFYLLVLKARREAPALEEELLASFTRMSIYSEEEWDPMFGFYKTLVAKYAEDEPFSWLEPTISKADKALFDTSLYDEPDGQTQEGEASEASDAKPGEKETKDSTEPVASEESDSDSSEGVQEQNFSIYEDSPEPESDLETTPQPTNLTPLKLRRYDLNVKTRSEPKPRDAVIFRKPSEHGRLLKRYTERDLMIQQQKQSPTAKPVKKNIRGAKILKLADLYERQMD